MARNEYRTARLREIVDYLITTGKAYNKTDLYTKLGKNKSQMSETFTGKRPVSHELVQRIVEVFPEINPYYLLDPACADMLRDVKTSSGTITGDQNNVNNGHDQNINTAADVNRLLQIIEKQQEQIDSLIKILASK